MRNPISSIRYWLIKNSRLSDFEKRVLIEVCNIKFGEKITYKELARRIKREDAYRAVGNALSKNPYPLIIPCHRIVSCNSIGGYKLGKHLKSLLLLFESYLSRLFGFL